MNTELKRCPFCGCVLYYSARNDNHYHRAKDSDCLFRGTFIHADQRAAWNRRHPSAPSERWLPIESAPKDGRTILTMHEKDLFPVAAFCLSQGEEEIWLREVEGPEDLPRTGKHEQLYRVPTHWQPLPPPPAAIADAMAQPEDGR